MAFEDQNVYNKHQSVCDCEDKSTCSCNNDDCGCCPPGLVGVRDCNGNHIACLTPEDAAEYEVQKEIPANGFIKVFHPTTGDFVAILSVTDALAYLAAVDPAVSSPVAPGLYNISTTDDIDMSAPADTFTDEVAVDFGVDRVSCTEAVAIVFSGVVPPGVTFLGGANSLNIPVGQSIVSDGILIDDQVDAGVFVLTVAYTSCGGTKTKTLTLNVT